MALPLGGWVDAGCALGDWVTVLLCPFALSMTEDPWKGFFSHPCFYFSPWALSSPLTSKPAAEWRSSDLVHLACSPFLLSLLIIHLTLHTTKCEARSGLMSSGSRPACLVSLHTGEVLLHILWGSQNEGDSLVNTLWLHLQYRLGACGCHASCLLDNIGHGIAFIQEPELQKKRGQCVRF